MPHLIKEYAKSLGVKTSKPVVKDHFFPVLADKYITIQTRLIILKAKEYYVQV